MQIEGSKKNTSFGMIFMLGSGLCFVAVIGLVKNLDGALPAAQASFIRYFIGVIFFIPFFFRGSAIQFRKSNFWPYFIRSIFHSLGVVFWFYAMSKLPVAEVTAIGYMTPVFVTLGAVIFFKEKISFWRIGAIILAFLGVLLILRPGFQNLIFGHAAQISATMFFAGSYLMVKELTRTESATAIVAMMTLFVTIALAPLAFIVWVSPSLMDIIALSFVALFATLGHFFMTKALALAPLVVVQPVTFLQLVWATLLGILVFGEGVDPFVVIGGGLIIVSITLISYRENIRKIKSKS
ncbi:MAG: DMT family transporter [Paracoccaceae bacterium]|nr:DMT family transporter [Paracoccaceae bacterium]